MQYTISMRRYLFSLFALCLFGILFSPFFADAAGVSITTKEGTHELNQSVTVVAHVETDGQPINTVSGNITFSPQEWDITDVRYGNSILSLWVTKPTINKEIGTISFAGGVPGGFTGEKGILFTITARSKKIGKIGFGTTDVHVLLNDGFGTELSPIKNRALVVSVEKASPTAVVPQKNTEDVARETAVPPAPVDRTLPEDFVPLISRHPTIYQNDTFVSFSAVDKDSGIDHYEVKETPKLLFGVLSDSFSTPWVPATSPHRLSYQQWGTTVFVRAYDQAGNTRIGFVEKSWGIAPILLFFALAVFLTILITRFEVLQSVRKYTRTRRSRKRI